MAGRPEERMLKLALIEYQHALHAAAFAQYRQANMSLRLFLELSLGAIQFSAHEIDARLWLSGSKDNRWGEILSEDTGVLSKRFCSAFFEELGDHIDQYRTMAKTLYRECSEYVHGNSESYNGIEGEIRVQFEALDEWLERSDTARLIVKFCLVLRFITHADTAVKSEIEDVILEDFSHVTAISSVYQEASV